MTSRKNSFFLCKVLLQKAVEDKVLHCNVRHFRYLPGRGVGKNVAGNLAAVKRLRKNYAGNMAAEIWWREKGCDNEMLPFFLFWKNVNTSAIRFTIEPKPKPKN